MQQCDLRWCAQLPAVRRPHVHKTTGRIVVIEATAKRLKEQPGRIKRAKFAMKSDLSLERIGSFRKVSARAPHLAIVTKARQAVFTGRHCLPVRWRNNGARYTMQFGYFHFAGSCEWNRTCCEV